MSSESDLSSSEGEAVRIPQKLWSVMEPRLRASLDELERYSPMQKEGALKYGLRIGLRLQDGTVKEQVTVDWNGSIINEWYEEFGIRGEVYQAPRFKTADVESWGMYKGYWAPTWSEWFGRKRRWQVFAYADGQLGEPS